MSQNLSDRLEDLDTTMSFVLKVRHKAWIKAQTLARKEHDKRASDSQTLREVLDAAMAAEGKEAVA